MKFLPSEAPMSADDITDTLLTPRDYLRYATSRFSEAGLVFGHGTTNAFDEAAYLILHTLHLPIDQLDPWLDARLLKPERKALAAIIDKRVATRKPAPYLTNEAWIQGHSFYVDERVIVPRSYLGELLLKGLDGAIPEPDAVSGILDLCTGSGCLAILAALTFPGADVDAADISEDALDVARRNVDDYQLGDHVALFRSDLFQALEGRRYDLILSNPPYVSADVVAAFPPEYAAEPLLAHAGGDDGLDIVRRILGEAGKHLNPGGTLIVEVGTGREILEAEYPQLPFLWLDTANAHGEVFALSAETLPAA
jgi:ribosomal protein L3 glutamine methyltransferase